MTQTQDAKMAISQIAIPVQDVERASAFYRDVLGLPFLFDAQGMSFFDCGGVRLMLSRPSEPRFDHPASIIYYSVADLDAAFGRCAAAGAAIEREPHRVHRGGDFEIWMAFLRDSEENVFALATQRDVEERSA